jgi:hypothetical protein
MLLLIAYSPPHQIPSFSKAPFSLHLSGQLSNARAGPSPLPPSFFEAMPPPPCTSAPAYYSFRKARPRQFAIASINTRQPHRPPTRYGLADGRGHYRAGFHVSVCWPCSRLRTWPSLHEHTKQAPSCARIAIYSDSFNHWQSPHTT